MQAWDTLIVAISLVPCPDLLHSLFDPELMQCKQLQPAFAVLDGNEGFSNADQLKFLYNSATRVVENLNADRTKQERLRAAQTSQNPALAALNQQAADAAATAANPPLRRPRTRSPRKATTPGMAAVPPVQQSLAPPDVCRAFSNNGTCNFGDRCSYKHLHANGKEKSQS